MAGHDRSMLRVLFVLAIAGAAVVIGCGTDGDAARDATPPHADAAGAGTAYAQALSVSPASGGQRTTFRVQFISSGPDVGPDEDGYNTLTLQGPPGTPCAGRFPGTRNDLIPFDAGPATFTLGPFARRPAYGTNERAYRPVIRVWWCPGVYRGSVLEDSFGTLGVFRFTVAPSVSASGRRNRRTRLLTVALPTNRGVRITPRRPGPRSSVHARFQLARRTRLSAMPLFEANPDCTGHEAVRAVRPGRVTVVGGRSPPRRGEGQRLVVLTRRPLCRGRWIVEVRDFDDDKLIRAFTFHVR